MAAAFLPFNRDDIRHIERTSGHRGGGHGSFASGLFCCSSSPFYLFHQRRGGRQLLFVQCQQQPFLLCCQYCLPSPQECPQVFHLPMPGRRPAARPGRRSGPRGWRPRCAAACATWRCTRRPGPAAPRACPAPPRARGAGRRSGPPGGWWTAGGRSPASSGRAAAPPAPPAPRAQFWCPVLKWLHQEERLVGLSGGSVLLQHAAFRRR
mmetsp:Transcript_52562/g.76787  ORF Transcript_52562/g.76787 Transcript_52562/m.76787 type:complete len:208 (+) Transcript_52562:233-856(+)